MALPEKVHYMVVIALFVFALTGYYTTPWFFQNTWGVLLVCATPVIALGADLMFVPNSVWGENFGILFMGFLGYSILTFAGLTAGIKFRQWFLGHSLVND